VLAIFAWQEAALKQRHQVLVLISLLSAISYLDRVCISVAGPRIQQALGLTPVQWGWVGSLFAISYSIFEIPSGYLGDRIGARSVLTRIVLWWSGFTALTGLAWNYASLLVTRFLFGAGEAGAVPNMFVGLARWFPLVERARAASFIMMSAELGTALTPLIVIPLQRHYGWRFPFFALAVIGAIWVAAWSRWYHDHPSDSPGITATELEEIGHTSAKVQHVFPWKSAARSRNLWIIISAGVSFRYGVYFFQFWLPMYLVKSHGFTETGLLSTAWLFLAGAIANILGGTASDKLVKQVGLKAARRVVPVLGTSVSAVCLMLSPLVDGKYPVLVLLSFSYCGLMFAQAVCWAVCIDIGASFAGAVSAARNTGAQAGAAVSSALFGYMVAKTGNYNTALIPGILMIALSALLCWLVDATEQLFPEAVPKAVSTRFA
jgi:MFS transporter, ACS family, glucarate transporter